MLAEANRSQRTIVLCRVWSGLLGQGHRLGGRFGRSVRAFPDRQSTVPGDFGSILDKLCIPTSCAGIVCVYCIRMPGLTLCMQQYLALAGFTSCFN
jgi:hypothetical protein